MLFAIFCLLGLQAFAQTVTGTVTNKDTQEGMPQVAITVKGTNNFTYTQNDGTFSIGGVTVGVDSLVFNYTGFAPKTMVASADMVVELASEIDLGDVVVTALGISRDQKSLGYAIQEVGGDDVNTVKSGNFVNQLSGKVSGVQIQTNTNFGGSTNIVVRGSSSLTGNNQALFVIDGVPVSNALYNDANQARGGAGYDYGNTAADINPNDIESISILKGAAATALYGSRAANGVVLITTKKGNASKALGVAVSTNYTVGMIDKTTFPEYQQLYGAGYAPQWSLYEDGEGNVYVPTTEDASYGSAFDESIMAYQWNSFIPGLDTYGQKTPWVAAENGPLYFFDNSSSLSNSVELSGGSQNATYRLSYQNVNQTGILPNSHLAKNNVSLSGTYNLTPDVKVTSYANFVNTSTVGRNSTGYSGNIMSGFRQWWQVNVDMKEQEDAYNLLGTNATWNMYGPENLSPIYWDNFYWQRYQNYQSDDRNRFLGYTQLDWELNDFMSFTARASVDNYSFVQEERRAIGSVANTFGVAYDDLTSGYAIKQTNFTETNFDFIANFKHDFSDAFTFRGLLGSNIRNSRNDYLYASTNSGLVVPNLYSLANSVEALLPPIENSSNILVYGYFANASFGIANMLYLEGSVRVDQSSTLPLDNNTYLYPSGSASFLFSELFEADWLSLGKFRVNYAEVGSSAPFARLQDVYYQSSSFAGNAVFSNGATKFNPALLPERTKSLEAGLTLNFGKDSRVGLDLAVYNNNSIDQIMPVAISYATGYTYKYVNAGDMNNKGVEVMLNLTPVKSDASDGFRWDINLNWSKNVNTVVSLADGVDNLQLASLQGGVSINARVGEPYGTIQGTDYIYDSYNDDGTPAEGANPVVGDNGYYLKTSTSDQVIGDINPDWIAGLRNSFSYKGFNFSFLIDWKQGGDVFSLDLWYGMGTGLYPETAAINDLGNNVRDDIIQNDDGSYDPTSGGVILDGVNMEISDAGDTSYVTNNIRAYAGWYGNPWGWGRAANAQHIYDASYIKLREASITYSLPSSMFDNSIIGGVSFGVVGSNLWIIHKNLPYADPETSQGAGNIQGWQSGVLPTTRNIGFTLNVKF